MKLPRRKFLQLAAGAAALCRLFRARREGADLSGASGALNCRLRGWRRSRRLYAASPANGWRSASARVRNYALIFAGVGCGLQKFHVFEEATDDELKYSEAKEPILEIKLLRLGCAHLIQLTVGNTNDCGYSFLVARKYADLSEDCTGLYNLTEFTNFHLAIYQIIHMRSASSPSFSSRPLQRSQIGATLKWKQTVN